MPHETQEAENAKAAFLTSDYKRKFTDDCVRQQLNLTYRRVKGKSKICLVLRSTAVEKGMIFFSHQELNLDSNTKSWVFFSIILPNTRIDISEIG